MTQCLSDTASFSYQLITPTTGKAQEQFVSCVKERGEGKHDDHEYLKH